MCNKLYNLYFRDLDSREKFMGVFREQAASFTKEDQFREKNQFSLTHTELDNMVPVAMCGCNACTVGLWCP